MGFNWDLSVLAPCAGLYLPFSTFTAVVRGKFLVYQSSTTTHSLGDFGQVT